MLEGLAQKGGVVAAQANPGAPRFLFTDVASMPWRASAYVEGVEVIDLGPANGRSMQLVRCRPGTTFPM
jgi:hypothetical protein